MPNSLRSLREQIGGNLAGDFTKMTEAIRKFVEENEDGLIKTLKAVATDIERANWKGFAETIGNAAQKVNGVAQEFGGWKTVMEGLIALKVMAWLTPIVTAAGTLAGSVGVIRSALGAAGLVGGLAAGGLAAMKKDSETGNNTRTRLREKLGIEDPKEPAPWMPGGQFETGPSLGQLLNPARRLGPNATWHSRMHGLIPFHANADLEKGVESGAEKGAKKGFLDGIRDGWNELFHLNSYIGGGGARLIRASYGAFNGGLAGGAGAPMGGGGPAARGVGGGVDAVRRALGGAGGASGTVNVGKNRVAAGVADAWRKAGMSEAGIAGVLGNIQQESAFNPGLRHPDQPRFGGEAHFAHGLYQEGGDEWNHYAAWLAQAHPGGDWRDPDFQNEFAAANLKKNYPRVWAEMNRAGSPEEAAIAYRRGYLKPAPWAANDANRTSSARQFFQSMPAAAAHRNTFIAAAAAARAARARQQAQPRGMITADLLDSARGAGFGVNHRVTGEAAVRIDLNGAPRGTRTQVSASGMFKQVALNRGRVPYADQEA